MAKPVTSHTILEDAVKLANKQLKALKSAQNKVKREGGDSVILTEKIGNLLKSIATLTAEIRKTSKDAEKAVAELTPERQAELILHAVGKLSPEYRQAVALYIQELDGKLIH